ncbi:protein trichome birefringence-like 34 [Brachypodium distachyon]|nr:protein trichome birefringence-like 34 [Brachypodium distachyon]|eukprot:XP_003577156.1 protein trichome birefringence-like 34 [Brachypodium distachyon]
MMMKVSPRVSVHVCLCNTRPGAGNKLDKCYCAHYNKRGGTTDGLSHLSNAASSPEKKMKPEQGAHNKMSASAAVAAASSLSPLVGLRAVVSSLVAFFIVVSSVSLLFDRGGQESRVVQLAMDQHRHQEVKMAAAGSGKRQEEECNWSVGRWVYDNASEPLYSGLKCSFIFDEVACEKYGRNDTRYQHWRWQPDGCDLPRFNATRLLEKLRNKRMVFVGDSINRNQWVSMVCMVEAAIPEGLKMRVYNGSLISFKAFEYNATIDFYWSPLILESNSDNPIIHRVEYRIIRAEKIEKHARAWRDADIIVFNSYLWWRKQKPDMKMKVMYGSFEDGDAKLDEVEMVEGFEIALKKLTEWLGTNIDKNKTRIYFAGSSPTHTWASDWGGDDKNKCLNESEPIVKPGYKGATTDYSMMEKAQEIFRPLEEKGIHVQVLNFTQLSDHRIDAHPTVFRRQFVPLTAAQVADPSSYADCTHWCLPGVPDVWNSFLYSYLVHK